MHCLLAQSIIAACPPTPPSPPAPPVAPVCTAVMGVVGGSMSPACFTSNCTKYGPTYAYDQDTTQVVAGLAITDPGGTTSNYPWMQFDLGANARPVYIIELFSRFDASWTQSNSLNVYLSTLSGKTGVVTTCATGVTFSFAGEAKNVSCPVSSGHRYIFIERQYASTETSRYLALLEVRPYTSCEYVCNCETG